MRAPIQKLIRRPSRSIPSIILALLLLTAVNEWLITPVVAALRANQTNWLHNIIGGHVGTWNGISYLVYLLCSLIGLALAIQLLRLANPQH